jgi:hypothetical protein
MTVMYCLYFIVNKIVESVDFNDRHLLCGCKILCYSHYNAFGSEATLSYFLYGLIANTDDIASLLKSILEGRIQCSSQLSEGNAIDVTVSIK